MTVRYMLDTNICIYIAKHNPPAVRERFLQHHANELAISVVTYGELQYGAAKSQAREKAMQTVTHLASLLTVAEMESEVGEHYGQIRSELEKQGRVIGNNDLWLAAHARANGWTLVTNNEREFVRVSALRVENWVKVEG